ncbi:putative MFS family arabinose efflux permease [Tepidimonas ignava]|uniref:Lysophospholipid transporter LplT n=1 Tax=Tepidimonas ignava TaxID=114249 RepID=A0A4R3LFV2_9BURK|nr:lysophospholipid transporter LplT [Tepidimonas ignava]TCS98400.1 putative MFS family arabinose efflux permease [Tepidimonas ignava]TSE19562.1 Lysophospholipid transporter LplT [Tepidimonas ignava]
MKRGFYTIMAAQFCSSLADNALFVVAVELLRSRAAPEWQAAALVPMFALFYVLLAPWVGAFADSRPKGQVMFISNAIKVVGCVLMLTPVHPLLAYSLVGLGAAAYSPAKYGILTELLPPSQLVKANGWIEGLTIASIILGVVLGGQLVSPRVAAWLGGHEAAWLRALLPGAAEVAIVGLVGVYALAAAFNLRIPRTTAPLRHLPSNPLALLPDFWRCNLRLWRDHLGQISLATTTLFWGVSGNLRYIVLAWAAAALGYNTTQASSLVGVVAVGTAVGAIVASVRMRIDQAPRVIPLGIAMGLLVVGMIAIRDVWVAAPFLVLLGALGGFLVVPMNALLQHRGHNLMGAGRSIAVQNFNEQACILGLGFMYSAATGAGLSAFGAITAFGLLVAVVMALIQRWHARNLRRYPHELQRLFEIARRDDLHG